MDSSETTIIICCAGMGTRLGIGTTKALVNIKGKPLIIYQLEQLKDYDDIRVVVGFEAENVIKTVKQYRDDIVFVFNYDYKNTGPAASLSKALLGARKNIITIDGDLLVNPDDFKTFLDYPDECIPISEIKSQEPVLVNIENDFIINFSEITGNYEWTGLAKLKKDRLKKENGYIFEMIKPLLPIKTIKIRTRGIDTPEDYEEALNWIKNNYLD